MNAATSKTPVVTPVKDGSSSNMLTVIAQAAADPRVDVSKMTVLLELQEKLLAREAQNEFNQALARMNTEDLRVSKHGTVSLGSGGKTSYKFAKWEDMDKVIRPLMKREGFTLSFDTEINPAGGIIVIGELLHEGGHSRKARIPLVIDTGPGRNPLQGMGSTVSYGKRYVTEMLLNIVREDEDDDGQAGGGAYRPPPQQQARYQPTERQRTVDVPPDPPQPKKRTTREWLNSLYETLQACHTAEEVETIAASEQVVKALAALKNGALAELEAMLAEAEARVNKPDDPTPEPDDDVFPGDVPLDE